MHAMKQVLSFIFVIALTATVTAQDGDPELSTILQRVRERVIRHYLDLQSLAWTDTVKEEAPGEKPRELFMTRLFVFRNLLLATMLFRSTYRCATLYGLADAQVRKDVRVSRQTHTLSNYKRFTGDAKVISVEGAPK